LLSAVNRLAPRIVGAITRLRREFILSIAKFPTAKFHKALHLSYPNAADRERARQLGVSPGGDVEIHGLGGQWGWIGSQHLLKDWTDGCVAVTNEEIDEIWPLVQTGIVVEIRP
jgi:murein L,D-transpeptidase YafK